MKTKDALTDRISVEEADAFCSSIETALQPLDFSELKAVRLIRRSSVAVSFDGDWQPFLGHTLGYNGPNQPPRIPIGGNSRVLNLARDWLQRLSAPTPGGRVFVTKQRLFCHRSTLGTWLWDASCPVDRIRVVWQELQSRRVTQAKRECADACKKARLRESQGDLDAAKYYWSHAHKGLAGVDRETDFERILHDVDSLIESMNATRVAQAMRGCTDACLKARLEELKGDQDAAKSHWSRAHEYLAEVDRETEFETILDGVDSSMKVATELLAVLRRG